MKHHTPYFALFSLAALGAFAQPCLAASIQLDFSALTWNTLSQDQFFDLQLNTPNKNVSYSLNDTAGIAKLNPVVAANFAAIERSLVINLNGGQPYEQLEVQVDFHFMNGVAYGQINTFGMYAIPAVMSPPSQAYQTYAAGLSMPPDPISGAVLLASNSFTFDFLKPVKSPALEAITPILTGGINDGSNPTFSGGGPGFNAFDALDAPEPATLLMLGSGLGLLGLLRRKRLA